VIAGWRGHRAAAASGGGSAATVPAGPEADFAAAFAAVLAAILAIALLVPAPARAYPGDDLEDLPPPFPFVTDFDDRLVHVHPEVNYALHPDWLARWERGRMGRGGMLGTFGSSATDELMVDARWALNPGLGGGLRLRNDIVWLERRHLPHDRRQIWLGLEQRLWRGLGVLVQTVPAEDKERIDLRLGGVWTSADRTRYIQLLYRHDDLVYDEKNARDATSSATARGVDWLLRLESGPWSLFSRGHWLGEFDREYPVAEDPARTPVIVRHGYAANEALVRARWQPAPRTQVELAWELYEDAERRFYRGEAAFYDHDFAGRYRLLSLRAVAPLGTILPSGTPSPYATGPDRPARDRWRLRGELHQVSRRATVSGYRAFDHARDDVLYAVYAEWRLGSGSRERQPHWLELGYLGTWFEWRDTTRGDRSGYGDKVELGFVANLARGSALKISLSQEVSEGSFGGGNLRYIAWF